MYHDIVDQFSFSLANLEGILAKAEAFAASHNFGPDVFLASRLAPDMLPFVRQVQIACDAAKNAGAAVAAVAPPKMPDTEASLAELRARIAQTRAFLDGLDCVTHADPERLVSAGYPPDKRMRLHDYLVMRQMPNFYFHVTAAYALLRHWGVPVGKGDYLGELPLV
jgi:hypothetical protein